MTAELKRALVDKAINLTHRTMDHYRYAPMNNGDEIYRTLIEYRDFVLAKLAAGSPEVIEAMEAAYKHGWTGKAGGYVRDGLRAALAAGMKVITNG